MFVDSHAHIDSETFDDDRDMIVERARNAGVEYMLNVGTGDPHDGSIERGVLVAERYENVLAAVGVHPHDAKLFDESAEAFLRGLIENRDRVVALGEIGLDYHYDHSPREVQCEVFRRQLRLARTLGVPVIIHSRSADDETVRVLREEWNGSSLPGIMHCFSGGQEMANAVLDLGFLISFSGNVTFKNAGSLREVARSVPADRLLAETDCPYLTPVPHRGKRNEPARVVDVVRTLADVRGVTIESLGQSTSENFMRLFELESS
jgi:TatD DNase family protein